MASKTKNRRKLLKRVCTNCKSLEDLFQDACRQCGTSFLGEGEAEIRDKVEALVNEVEAAINTLESGQGGPQTYKILDRTVAALKKLKGYSTLPGMDEYLEASKAVLQPHRISVLKTTLRTNVVFFCILLVFPLLPLALGWDMKIVGLLFLPPLFWAGVTAKAYRDLKKAEQ